MANFAGIVLVLTFVIILVLINVGLRPPTIVEGSEEPVEVAEVATEVPLPTETSIPSTVEPTATSIPPTIEPTPTEVVQAESTGSSESASVYDPSVVKYGETLFISCGACHGVDGMGITGLGKDLVDSEFVHGLSDDELVTFIKTGRPVWDAENTTGVDMPPRGGNPTLTDDDILAVVAYIRSLSGVASEEPISDDSNSDVSTASVSAYDPSVVKYGETLFISCGACHGVDGMGITGLGKDLVGSEFVHGLSDDELVAFIKTGRPVWDAENTTGVDMPPRGGNPTLTDDDILAVIAYIRSLGE